MYLISPDDIQTQDYCGWPHGGPKARRLSERIDSSEAAPIAAARATGHLMSGTEHEFAGLGVGESTGATNERGP